MIYILNRRISHLRNIICAPPSIRISMDFKHQYRLHDSKDGKSLVYNYIIIVVAARYKHIRILERTSYAIIIIRKFFQDYGNWKRVALKLFRFGWRLCRRHRG